MIEIAQRLMSVEIRRSVASSAIGVLAIGGCESVAVASSAQRRAVLELEINGVRGDSVIAFLSDREIWVPLAALERGALVRVRAPRRRLLQEDYVELSACTPGLKYQVDERDLTLAITAPPAAFAKTKLDVSAPRPRGVWYTDDTSVYLSYAPSLLNLRRFRGFVDAGVSAGSFRLSSSASYEPSAGPVRLLTQLVFSDRKHLREVTLGDTYVSTGALGGAAQIAGVSVARNFELDPYFVRVPHLGYQGSVSAPSTLDVYVNDVLVRRVELAPGDFQLTGVAPTSGAGNVRYVIRDPLGQQSEVNARYYLGSTLLGRGISEYSVAAGLLRRRYGISSLNYGDPVLLGRYRLGILSGLTLGGRAEVGPKHLSAGAEFVVSAGFGELEFGWGASVDSDGTLTRGSAGFASYAYREGPIALRSTIKGTSRVYSTVGLTPASDRNLIEHSTATSIALSSRITLSAQLGIGFARDAGRSAYSSVSFNASILRGLWGQLVASRSDTSRGNSRYEVFCSLSFALPAENSGTISGRVSSRGAEASATVARPVVGANGLGYQLSTTQGVEPHYVANTQVQTKYFRAAASYFNDAGRSSSILEGSGTLVWLPSAGVFLSRPIAQSFAVVEVPNTPGIETYLNNRPVGRTNAAGQVFVPDLLSYYGNRVRVDGSELGPDQLLDEEEVVVAPPSRGGARVVFSLQAVRLVRGKLDPRGTTLEALRYGQVSLRIGQETWSSPIGLQGEFEFDKLPSGSWTATAEGPGARCTLLLSVHVDRASIENIGKVACFAVPADEIETEEQP